MIGLGSNRLTVCRRGGMSVTQAGRGGMEWLAGGRWPRWSTPYSAQATAYFKQNYGEYFSEILDYGRRNPTFVPYINEDPDIVASLLDVGKVRKLFSDGTAYIDTGLPANTTRLCVDCNADPKGMTRYANTLFGAEDTLNNGWYNYSIVYHSIAGIGLRVGTIGNQDIASGVANNTPNVHFESITTDTTFELIVNGTSKGIKTKGNIVSKAIYLYRMNCGGADGTVGTPSGFRYIRFYADNADIKHFVPFKLGVARSADQVYPSSKGAQAVGTLGMLDLVTGLFHPNANSSGQFTELIESPS